uniref:RNA-dependent RNA polymerase n=1 Tax=Aegilops tauschii subsp. strangulata TaxID=200361 RepID=A0A453EDM5_AEGTS
NVLVYKHPGLHFGDIHVLTSRYIEDIHDVVGYSRYAILFPTSGPRSLADEMANSDFDGDMYWVSINEQLLKQFKPSKPWEWGQVNKPIQAEKKCLLDLDEPLLERSLFHEFLKARFARSNALGAAADTWLVYMDRLLTDGVDEYESNILEKKIKKLVDIYYLALDAPKAGTKINVPAELTAKKYPHYMDRKESYHSTSILGKIYDEAEKKQSEKVEPVEISLDPRFTARAASSGYKYLNLWTGRYQEYLNESGPLIDNQDKEETDLKFKELYQKYKYVSSQSSAGQQQQHNRGSYKSILKRLISSCRCSTMPLNSSKRRGTLTKCSTRHAQSTRSSMRKQRGLRRLGDATSCGMWRAVRCAISTLLRPRATRCLSR